MSGENKRVAHKYHELNPNDIDDILTPDFIGRGNRAGFTWDRERHRKYLTTNRGKHEDTVHEQIADGDWVATRFTRTGEYDGKPFTLDAMQLKRFVGGKIAEIWEYFDWKGLEEQTGG